MIVRGRYLSRRALLRGVGGVAVALPFLDAMHPAFAAERKTAAAPVRRLGIVYYPHGVIYEKWTPDGDGGPLGALKAGLAPLERHKSKLTVVAGLTSSPDRSQPDFHDRACASWLTGCELTRNKVYVGVSMDQLAAAKLGKQTQFASLELSTELPYKVGICYKDATTELPFERNPRVVFERLFGDGGKIDPEAAARRDALDKSTLDAVTERISALKRRLGPADIRKLDQYLDSIRDIERRISIAQSKALPELPDVERPAGIPIDWVEHVKLMFDLQVLAYQADLTRVTTFLTAKEGSLMTFPQIGVNLQHHEASHHNYDPVKIDALHRINVHQSDLFAYYLDKLDAVKEASGSLLDNSVILFGSTLSNPTVHSQRDLPVMLAGTAGGRIRGGRFVREPGDPPPWPFAAKWDVKKPTPFTNLHLTLLDMVGVPTEKIGDSTGRLSL